MIITTLCNLQVNCVWHKVTSNNTNSLRHLRNLLRPCMFSVSEKRSFVRYNGTLSFCLQWETKMTKKS